MKKISVNISLKEFIIAVVVPCICFVICLIAKKILDTEMLITGKKSKKTLSEKYLEEKAKNSNTKKTKESLKKNVKQSYSMKTKKSSKDSKSSLFKIFLIASTFISPLLLHSSIFS